MRKNWLGLAVVAFIAVAFMARAEETVSRAEFEALKKEIEASRKDKVATVAAAPIRSSVDNVLENKYGPNANVTTKAGKLTISGLLQVWYYSIQNDHNGLFADPNINNISDTNETQDNDSFRIRRTELKFTMDIHENVTGVIMFDPAREANAFPSLPDNQGSFKRTSQIAPEFTTKKPLGTNSSGYTTQIQKGDGSTAPRLLQDAFINYHGVVPHHDFQIGQFKPWLGEEGIRSSGQLDFAERTMLGQLGDTRDMGASVHGSWWGDEKDGRVQYWLGLFNGAGNYMGSAGQFQNRSDDNDFKDFNYRVLVRPVWKNKTWGSLELGMSSEMGKHGEAGGADPIVEPVNGLDRTLTWAMRHYAWGSYFPGGPVKGWWIRGEWAWIKDRNAPNSMIDLLGQGASATTVAGKTTPDFVQNNGKAFSVQGWYLATGYKISESCFCDCKIPSWFKPFEFTFRYETFQNVQTADLVNPTRTDVFGTSVYTAGINYYIKGHNAKIQANYNWVRDPSDESNANRSFHNVRNDNFIVNFQVAF